MEFDMAYKPKELKMVVGVKVRRKLDNEYFDEPFRNYMMMCDKHIIFDFENFEITIDGLDSYTIIWSTIIKDCQDGDLITKHLLSNISHIVDVCVMGDDLVDKYGYTNLPPAIPEKLLFIKFVIDDYETIDVDSKVINEFDIRKYIEQETPDIKEIVESVLEDDEEEVDICENQVNIPDDMRHELSLYADSFSEILDDPDFEYMDNTLDRMKDLATKFVNYIGEIL